MKELEEATKGRDINAKVLASHWGTVVLVLLVDIGKTQSLLGEETLSWVHSAVSLWVFSPMWLLRRFSAVAASPGRVPASMGGGGAASSPGTLFLTPTMPPTSTHNQNNNFNSQLQSPVQRELGACFSVLCSHSSLILQIAFQSAKMHLFSCRYLRKSPGLLAVGSLRAGAGHSLCIPRHMRLTSFVFQ